MRCFNKTYRNISSLTVDFYGISGAPILCHQLVLKNVELFTLKRPINQYYVKKNPLDSNETIVKFIRECQVKFVDKNGKSHHIIHFDNIPMTYIYSFVVTKLKRTNAIKRRCITIIPDTTCHPVTIESSDNDYDDFYEDDTIADVLFSRKMSEKTKVFNELNTLIGELKRPIKKLVKHVRF